MEENQVNLKGIRFIQMDLKTGKPAPQNTKSIPAQYVLETEYPSQLFNTLVYPFSAVAKRNMNYMFCCFRISKKLFDKLTHGKKTGITLKIRAMDENRVQVFCEEMDVNFWERHNYFSCHPHEAMETKFHSAFVPVRINLANLTTGINSAVCCKEKKMLWEWCVIKSQEVVWNKICTNTLSVSLLIAPPSSPWRGTYSICESDEKCEKKQNEPYVWTPFLKWALCWADGSKTPGEAAEKIAENLAGISEDRPCAAPKFVYVPDQHYSNLERNSPLKTYVSHIRMVEVSNEMKIEVPHKLTFYGTSNLQYLDGMYGHGNKVNCTDMATLMMYLSNALGCKLAVARIVAKEGNIITKPLIPLGSKQDSNPILTQFVFHDIAYSGDINKPDKMLVYDPCFSFPGNEHAIGMPYSKYAGLLFENPKNILSPVPYSKECAYCIE